MSDNDIMQSIDILVRDGYPLIATQMGRLMRSRKLVLPSESALWLVTQIIEVFEDFLEARHIDVPSEERLEAMQCECEPALLYGTDYGELETHIENILLRWGLVERSDA